MLPNEVLDSVVFLFEGEEAAKDHLIPEHKCGGTGWLIGVSWESDERSQHVYVVTNKHLIDKSTEPVVRVNLHNGHIDTFYFPCNEWHKHKSSDLAIHAIELSPLHRWRSVMHKDLLTNDHIEKFAVGMGDSVFSIGRFVNLTGQQQNRPVVRFGRIAMMPPAKIKNEDLLLVEMRSRTGYSGSPVWVYIDPIASRWTRGTENRMIDIGSPSIGPFLLGTQRGELFVQGPYIDDAREQERGAQSGMSAVVPIEKLEELLSMNKVVDERQKHEQDNPNPIESQTVPTKAEL